MPQKKTSFAIVLASAAVRAAGAAATALVVSVELGLLSEQDVNIGAIKVPMSNAVMIKAVFVLAACFVVFMTPSLYV